MFVPLRRLLTASAAVVALGALAACGGSASAPTRSSAPSSSAPSPSADESTASASAPTTPPAAMRGAPADGACYGLSHDDAQQAHNDALALPCDGTRTSQTYLVAPIAQGTDLADAAAVTRTADRQCRTALLRHVGATEARLALSRVASAWFVPDDQQIADGARWLRCDVIVEATDTTLARLPRTTAGLLGKDAALDRYGRCATTSAAGISAGKGGRTCDQKHTWRAIEAKRLGSAAAAYPGASARKNVLERCEAPARAYTDNRTRDIAVGWVPPTAAQWADGERFGLCWTRTRA